MSDHRLSGSFARQISTRASRRARWHGAWLVACGTGRLRSGSPDSGPRTPCGRSPSRTTPRQREDVTAGVRVPTLQLFRTHIRQRAGDEAHTADAAGFSPVESGWRKLARPKSSSFTPDFVSATLAGLRSRWTISDCARPPSRRRSGCRSRMPDAAGGRRGRALLEGLTFRQFHHEGTDALLVHQGRRRRRHAARRCAGGSVSSYRARFALEALTAVGSMRKIGSDDFDRDGPVEARIPGAVDLPHAPRTHRLQNLERTELVPGCRIAAETKVEASRPTDGASRKFPASSCARSRDSTSRRISGSSMWAAT